MNPEVIANLALLGIEALRTYQTVSDRLAQISQGKEVQVSDLAGFEADTRSRLDALKAKLEAQP